MKNINSILIVVKKMDLEMKCGEKTEVVHENEVQSLSLMQCSTSMVRRG